MQYPNNKEGIQICYLTTRTHAITEGCHVGEQDQPLLIHRLIEAEVTHFEKHHCACPKHHQTGVGYVGAKEATRQIDQSSVTRPPGIAGGFLVFTADDQRRIKGRFHGAEPLLGR